MKIMAVTVVALPALVFAPEPWTKVLTQVPVINNPETRTILFLGIGLILLSWYLRKLGQAFPKWRMIVLTFQHFWNPLHLHCRLVQKGWEQETSLTFCRAYEKLLFFWINKLSLALGVNLRNSGRIHQE